jgi:hypothetical protein
MTAVILRSALWRASRRMAAGACGASFELAVKNGEHLRMTVVNVARLFICV